MATGAEVRSYVRRAFGDEDSVQIKDEDIVRWINAAQRNISISQNVLKQVSTTGVVSGQVEYDISGLPILQIQTIHYRGRPLDHRSFQNAEEHILSNDPDRTQTGTPTMWYSWGTTLFLWPTPDSSGDDLKLYYLSRPENIATIGDQLSLPDQYFDRIVEFVMSQAYELDEDNQNSDFKLGQFKEGLAEMAGNPDRPQNNTYPSITVLPEDAW